VALLSANTPVTSRCGSYHGLRTRSVVRMVTQCGVLKPDGNLELPMHQRHSTQPVDVVPSCTTHNVTWTAAVNAACRYTKQQSPAPSTILSWNLQHTATDLLKGFH
jgi:hypothetical protein